MRKLLMVFSVDVLVMLEGVIILLRVMICVWVLCLLCNLDCCCDDTLICPCVVGIFVPTLVTNLMTYSIDCRDKLYLKMS